MEATPPSYDKATQVNCWDIIAQYIPSDDLCSAALVSRTWHAIFAPHLWGNPASHFGIENDAVYVALTRFKRTLQTARLRVRSLTHTLHLPPAHAELYNGPHADWLRDILDRLPNLQSLIVRGLPFFDYSALQALRFKPSKSSEDGPPDGVVELPGSIVSSMPMNVDLSHSFGLRFLDASRCSNVTSGSLAQALTRFHGLLYLDLSFTLPARDPNVLKLLCDLQGLQVLKLRAIHLNDDGLEVLAPAIARRVRSLDIRDNQITDRGIRMLLEQSFAYDRADQNRGQRSPGLLPYIGSEMLEIYQGEDFEGYLRNIFTRSFVGRLAIEDLPEGGITHLYLSNNAVSVEGLSGLIRSERLHVLDVDSVVTEFDNPSSPDCKAIPEDEWTMPGVEKLTPLMYQRCSESMTFLRIHHNLVTKYHSKLHADEVVHGRAELDSSETQLFPTHAAEIDGIAIHPHRFELPEESTPRYELAANPMDLAVSPIPDITTQATDGGPGPQHEFRRGSAIAPEPVDSLSDDLQDIGLVSPLSERGATTDTMTNQSWLSTLTPDAAHLSPSPPFETSNPGMRPRTYSSVTYERKARLNAHVADRHALHPAMLPHLETLILTNVPSVTSDKGLSDRLIGFICQCAEEATLAKNQARLDYSLPPGRRGHALALRDSARKVFALRRLVLEMAPEAVRRKSVASPWQFANTKSVTEDRDSESLWSAAETDFSFFGEEEMTLPTLEYGRYAHGPIERQAWLSDAPKSSNKSTKPALEAKFDTVSLLSAFRKERKAAHTRNVATGAVDPETEGHWDGIIQIVRPWNADHHKDEETDYYGNRFHKH